MCKVMLLGRQCLYGIMQSWIHVNAAQKKLLHHGGNAVPWYDGSDWQVCMYPTQIYKFLDRMKADHSQQRACFRVSL